MLSRLAVDEVNSVHIHRLRQQPIQPSTMPDVNFYVRSLSLQKAFEIHAPGGEDATDTLAEGRLAARKMKTN